MRFDALTRGGLAMIAVRAAVVLGLARGQRP